MFGPFPSSPLTQSLFVNRSIIVPAGTPSPPVGDNQVLITIQNEDDGFRVDNETAGGLIHTVILEPLAPTSDARTLTLDLRPCESAFVVFECVDRPIQISVVFADGTPSQPVILQGGNLCFDRTYYILREFFDGEVCLNSCFVDFPNDGNPFAISQSNNNRCDDGGEGSETNACPLGFDCGDCGVRILESEGFNTFTLSEANSMPRCTGGF